MTKERYIIGSYAPDGYLGLLSLDAYADTARAKRAVNWQGYDFSVTWYIVKRTGPDTFVTDDGKAITVPARNGWTAEAWERFKSERPGDFDEVL